MKDKADPAKPQPAPFRETPASTRRGSYRSGPHPIRELQSAAGNFAVQRLIQRSMFGKDHQIDDGNSERVGDAMQRGRQRSLSSETMQPFWQLQRQTGNQAMQQLLRSGFIQAKLAISHPSDPEELEADQVAQSIMSTPAGAPCSCAHGGPICEECQQKHLQPIIQRRATAPSAPTHIPRTVSDVLSSPGHPLDPGIRSFMEPRFGRDFSGVRVHTDAKAVESAAAVQARAYTVGNNIVFGGKESASNLPVLAHELAHVVQQSGASPALQRLYCVDFLEETRRPGISENPVRDSLVAEAALWGTVETELCIPAASFDPGRPDPQVIDTIIRTPPGVCLQGDGKADLAMLAGRTLEVVEVKEATWDTDWGAPAAEAQLRNYLDKADDDLELVTELWRRRGHAADTITRVEAMPMNRLNLYPRLVDGVWVELRWCDDGLIVFKVKPPEEEEEEPEPKEKESGPSDTPLEQLAKLGKDLWPLLAAEGLLNLATGLVAAVAGVLSSPLVMLAALVLGVVYFWDAFKSLAGRFADFAKGVWSLFTSILKIIGKLGIIIGEVVSFLAGIVATIAKKLFEGAIWVAGRIAAGARFIGGKIASAAEALWDWLWGSGPEPTVPIIEMPITETTEHCAMVAHEDAFVTIGSDALFDTDHWDLKPEAVSALNEAAGKVRSMLGHGDDQIRIEGYTDNVGSVEHNQTLSEQRANTVADWFADHGFPRSILHTEGYGKTKAQANDPAGRAKDRHVEIWVTKHGSVEKQCW